jgi:hypothetical protein
MCSAETKSKRLLGKYAKSSTFRYKKENQLRTACCYSRRGGKYGRISEWRSIWSEIAAYAKHH